ncbi:unnamed protein product [Didymodactylos carnosus]|uniref:PhnB-like domain-containing protein n=1 Tax=Didymodactylos carnosus TaxID=1234261 RepID=A0A814GU31_9BILA|nr:unnamed protein product [Didymodactylos carnosus]CAF1001011.1 unnamed protein product [Didymodactylos carnosus]CAF3614567.1 unnamed protein product [Didymodactylos carnosus]CAF3772470.1 unnamed protein product [Didymodactylos carnosus]
MKEGSSPRKRVIFLIRLHTKISKQHKLHIEAVNFYKDTISAQIESIQRYGDVKKDNESDKNRIVHAVMNIHGTKLMCSDACAEKNLIIGNNFSLSLDFKNVEDMQRTFDGLSTNGGKITMPIQDTFWNATFGMCTDKYGVNWMFNHNKPKS